MTSSRPRSIHRAAAAVLLAIVAVGLLGATLTAPLDRDESMYVSAGVMARTAALYTEVPFLQMPGLPWAYAAFLPAPGEGPLLLAARLATFLCGLFTVVAVGGIAWRRGVAVPVAAAPAVLLAVHPTFVAAIGQAANHLPPLAAVAGAAWLLAGGSPTSRRTAFAAGLLLGAAVAFRATWLVVVVIAAASVFALPAFRPRAHWIVAGIGVAWIPVVIAASPDPRAFLFQNLGYHEINRQWAIDSGLPWRLGRRALLDGFVDFARTPTGALWVVGVGLAIGAGARSRPRPAVVVATLAVLAAATVASALPSPWWSRHALPLVGVATLVAAAVVPATTTRGRVPTALAGALVVAALVLPGAPTHSVGAAFDPERWVPLAVHEEARALASAPEPVVSLSPLLALEAGRAIDPATVPGPFLVRVRERLVDGTPDAGGASILDLDPPPATVIVGVEPRYEDGLVPRLRALGYRNGATTDGGVSLWIREGD